MLVVLRCVCVRARACGCGCVWVFGGVCVCGCGMLICFVSALGSHEMGRHKLPIITIIIERLKSVLFSFLCALISFKSADCQLCFGKL